MRCLKPTTSNGDMLATQYSCSSAQESSLFDTTDSSALPSVRGCAVGLYDFGSTRMAFALWILSGVIQGLRMAEIDKFRSSASPLLARVERYGSPSMPAALSGLSLQITLYTSPSSSGPVTLNEAWWEGPSASSRSAFGGVGKKTFSELLPSHRSPQFLFSSPRTSSAVETLVF